MNLYFSLGLAKLSIIFYIVIPRIRSIRDVTLDISTLTEKIVNHNWKIFSIILGAAAKSSYLFIQGIQEDTTFQIMIDNFWQFIARTEIVNH